MTLNEMRIRLAVVRMLVDQINRLLEECDVSSVGCLRLQLVEELASLAAEPRAFRGSMPPREQFDTVILGSGQSGKLVDDATAA